MNLLNISAPGTVARESLLKAFAALEGPEWFWGSITRPSGYSLHDAIKWLTETRHMLSEQAARETKETGGDWVTHWKKACDEWPDSFVLYGNGGWHRYLVRPTGELVFSSHHATGDHRKKAEALGFRLG